MRIGASESDVCLYTARSISQSLYAELDQERSGDDIAALSGPDYMRLPSTSGGESIKLAIIVAFVLSPFERGITPI